MMRSPTTAEGNATIILRLGAMSSCRTTSISLSKAIQNFDLGVWIRGLKRVVAAAVSGGRSVPLVTFTPGRSRRFHLGDSIRRSSSPSQLGRDFLERNPTSAHNFPNCG